MAVYHCLNWNQLQKVSNVYKKDTVFTFDCVSCGSKHRLTKGNYGRKKISLVENIEKNIGVLATVGSTAPFIGLFGTVWGIMNSFQSIALSKNTSLAVVAPGIAEALLATALGLVAAIPAVIAYNKLSNNLNTYALRLQNFASEFEALLSRHLSEESSEK